MVREHDAGDVAEIRLNLVRYALCVTTRKVYVSLSTIARNGFRLA